MNNFEQSISNLDEELKKEYRVVKSKIDSKGKILLDIERKVKVAEEELKNRQETLNKIQPIQLAKKEDTEYLRKRIDILLESNREVQQGMEHLDSNQNSTKSIVIIGFGITILASGLFFFLI